MNKAYSTFEIKSADEDARILRGIASSASPDRMEDIVEPKGAKFELPLPLLSQHDHHLPIGLIHEAKITSKHIEIEAEIKKDTGLDYIEVAWKQLRAGLVRGLSIGFRALEWSFMEKTGGIHFKEWEWYELSAVTIPANAEATITSIKSFDQDPSKRSSVIHLLPGSGERTSKSVERARDRIAIAEQVLRMRR